MTVSVRERLLLAAILVLTVIVYAPVVSYEFTNWDDPAYVAANRDVRSPSLESLWRTFDPRTRVVSEWTPIVTSTHQIESVLLGGGPRVAHAGNLLLHLVCILLVWRLLRVCGAGMLVTVPGTLLFALHPVQAESIAWVSGRKTLLATAFSLGAALLALRGNPRPRRLLGALGLFVLAIGSKATAVVAPLWIGAGALLLDDERPKRARALLPWLGAMLVLGIVRGLGSLTMQAEAVRPAAEIGLAARLEITGAVFLSYLRQLVWPTDLCAHYAWSTPGAAGLGGWITLAALTALVARLGRREPRLGFFALVAGITLLPVSNVLPAPHFQADRYLFPALVGLAYVVPALLVHLPRIPPLAVAVALGAWVIAWTPVTRDRIEIWQDAQSLWTDTLECSPGFVVGWSNLGTAEAAAGRPEAAARAFEQALELDPDHLPAYANLGELLVRQGRLKEGEGTLRAGLARGEHPDLLNNLAWLRVERDPEEAARLAGRAVGLRPDHAAAWDTLGVARLRLGDAEGSRRALERGLELRPDLPELHYHLAETWVLLGDDEAAQMHARRALELHAPPDGDWVPDARRLAR
jgi:tetratricopeptide (TPR) repeat protein